MTEVLTSAQMRAIETAAFRSGEALSSELMERAGQAVVAAILAEGARRGDLPRRALVACGPGNNGGDGYVVARLLHDMGWDVRVAHFGPLDRMSPEAGENFRRWRERGGEQRWEPEMLETLPPSVVVDAVYGIGFRGSWDQPPALERLGVLSRRPGWLRVAVDIASGVDADTGRSGASITPMDLTVTFHAPKIGHVLLPGAEIGGRLHVADIGLRPGSGDWRGAAGPVDLVGPPDFALLAKGNAAHKFTHGHALVLGGETGRGGAARLAARAALRIGAGLVTVGPPSDALAENAARLDAVMLRPLDDAEGVERALADRRITALCLGPGLGIERAERLLPAALSAGRVLVLDADALTALAMRDDSFAGLHEHCVLTPHGGEFARLFPDLAEAMSGEFAISRIAAVRQASARAGAIVLLKGADTVIGGPDGRVAVHSAVGEMAAPWLATAGSGDVLAGLITGLLARGVAPRDAAAAAVWLHADAARRFGPGLLAEDLPDTLPECLRALANPARGRV